MKFLAQSRRDNAVRCCRISETPLAAVKAPGVLHKLSLVGLDTASPRAPCSPTFLGYIFQMGSNSDSFKGTFQNNNELKKKTNKQTLHDNRSTEGVGLLALLQTNVCLGLMENNRFPGK